MDRREDQASCPSGSLRSSLPARLSVSLSFRVHGANKLAAKHDRGEAGRAQQSPVQCDICQDRPAVLFCSEDRALILQKVQLHPHILDRSSS